MANSAYIELLKDPRWQKKRLEVFERDQWFCQACRDSESTLHVHHIKYVGANPWDTPNELLTTLCESCHRKEESLKGFDFYSMLSGIGITRIQFMCIMEHIKFRILRECNDKSTFWALHDTLEAIVPREDLSDYVKFLINGLDIIGSAKIAQPDLEQSQIEKQ